MSSNITKPFHIVMYPWFAFGHLTSFMELANKLAERGHKISFILPTKATLKLAPLNQHPQLINFIPISVPHVDGLPLGAETTNDAPGPALPLLMTAMDMTQDTIDEHLAQLKPDFIFFDQPMWVPKLARKHGARSLFYTTLYVMIFAYSNLQVRNLPSNDTLTEHDLTRPPPGFPSLDVKMNAYEARIIANLCNLEIGGMTFQVRLDTLMRESDAIGAKSCREIEGAYCDFFEKSFGKPVILAGPTVPKPLGSRLDDQFDGWLNGFGHGTVVYCAFGSECVLDKDKFLELILGLELSGKPFLVALKPPTGYETIESAIPKEFAQRTKGKGIVYGGWVQQQLILEHPSVGCFVTHCGAGSLSEALVSECQLVLMPQGADQFLNARLMSLELKVGIEVKMNENDGYFTKADVSEAISIVMDTESEVAKEIRANHTKCRNFFTMESLEESYISSFIQSMEKLHG